MNLKNFNFSFKRTLFDEQHIQVYNITFHQFNEYDIN